MTTSGLRAGLFASICFIVLATSACSPTGSPDEASPSAEMSSSPSADAADDAADGAGADSVATVGDTFEFTDGTTIGMLAEPWNTTDRIAGQLFHQLPVKPGTDAGDAVWGDLIAYVPDAAYGPGATAGEPVPADPVEWTLSHPDLEILDQREVTVDGVAATQIDARAVTPTNWLAVEGTPFEWGAEERVVLIPLEGSWLVVRGSTFQPDAAFAEEPAAGDPFDVMLQSVDLPG